MYILGISAYYHDSAATLIKDGRIIAAAQEERFSRKKQDSSFPTLSIQYCLSQAEIDISEVEGIVFYDKPLIKFERILETYLTEAPKGFMSFIMSMPIWLKDKLFLKETIAREIVDTIVVPSLGGERTKKQIKALKLSIYNKLLFTEHHQSHAASAFYPSPFEEAAILTVDGVGEWNTTTIAHGSGKEIKFLEEINFPHSLGLLYSAFTYYTGFKVNSGEYKVMGLAPYGKPIYVDTIKENLIDIKTDGSFRLNMKYFNYTSGLTMTNTRFDELFGGPPRKREAEITQKEMDIAASIQAVTEEVVIKMARHAQKITGSKNICLAGGVALNCVANGKILKNTDFEQIWVQPASGDSGGSLGAAFSALYSEYGYERTVVDGKDAMQGAYLGPSFSENEISSYLDSVNAVYTYYENEDDLLETVADLIAQGNVVGWHAGRMEFGPRALGNRSILGDPRNQNMQKTMNLKIKFRESFRPFAPSVLAEKVGEWFDLAYESPYMLMVAEVKDDKLLDCKAGEKAWGIDKLNVVRSQIPAVTHVDNTARIQTVHKDTNPRYYGLIERFNRITECPVVVNTSFNVRGEPVVCSPEDSYRCFMRTEMDVLVIDNFLLFKEKQPKSSEGVDWMNEFELD